jgi:Ca2+-binding EF-hand superfamily protein
VKIIAAQLDRDNDGKISLDEFTRWWRTNGKFQKMASIQDDSVRQAVDYFRFFDRDSNGRLDRNEVKTFTARCTM